MPDSIYYCTKENNNCHKCEECKRYVESDAHTCKVPLYKSACTSSNKRILFIKREDNITEDKESDSTEQTN